MRPNSCGMYYFEPNNGTVKPVKICELIHKTIVYRVVCWNSKFFVGVARCFTKNPCFIFPLRALIFKSKYITSCPLYCKTRAFIAVKCRGYLPPRNLFLLECDIRWKFIKFLVQRSFCFEVEASYRAWNIDRRVKRFQEFSLILT